MKWTNSYRSFGLKTKRSTGLKTIEHKHTSKPGAYTLVYTVSDAAGSEASVTRVATVKEKSGETPVEPGDKEPDKEPGKDTDKDGDKDDQGNKKPGLSATDASVSVVAIAAIGLLATGAVSVAVRRRRDI